MIEKIFGNTKALLIIIIVFTLLVYVFTMNQFVSYTDNGELASACVVLGIAHPTGYPLFTILAHLWSLLPLQMSEIMQLNLFSALVTSLSAAVLFLSIQYLLSNLTFTYITKNLKSKNKKSDKASSIERKIIISKPQINAVAIVTALSYSFATTIWQQANSLEVYALELLLLNIVLYFSIRVYFSQDNKKLQILLSLAFGLAMTNHMSSVLLVPGLLFLYFLNENNKLQFTSEKFKGLLILFIPILLALTLYLYLPIRSSMEPVVNWGWVHRSFSKFLYHLSGKQYQVWMFSGSETIIKNLKIYFSLLPYEFAFVGIVLILWGFIALLRKKSLLWYFVLLIAGNIIYSVNYQIFDIDSYFILSFIVLFIILSIGLAKLIEYKPFAIHFIGILFILNLVINFSENDHSEDFYVKEYTRNLLNNIDTNAIVISSQWDYFVGPFMYEQIVEGTRKDIILLEKELMRRTWYPLQFNRMHPEIYGKAKKEFQEFEEILEKFESGLPYNPNEIQAKYYGAIDAVIRTNINERPIYVTLDAYTTEIDYFKNYNVVPKGFALQLFTKDTVVKTDLSKLDLRYFKATKGMYKGLLPEGLLNLIAENLATIAIYTSQNNQIETALQAADEALFFDPKNPTAIRVKTALGKY
ncbi:MAG: DUF2723 domain-containing protein [Candidatus Kapaibacteriota bacterium]